MRNTPTSVVQTKMMIDHETIIQKHVFHCVSLCFTLTFDPSFTRQHVIHAKWTTLLKKYTYTYDYYNSVFCFIKQQISMNQWQLEFMTINDNQWQSMKQEITMQQKPTQLPQVCGWVLRHPWHRIKAAGVRIWLVTRRIPVSCAREVLNSCSKPMSARRCFFILYDYMIIWCIYNIYISMCINTYICR